MWMLKHKVITVKAAVYYTMDDIRIEEMPTPEIGPGEMLVEMKACGVCGSDLMEWYLQDRAPLVLGHEPAGVVVEVGEGVEKFRPGDRVFVHHHVGCLSCHYCTHGDFTMCEMFRKTHIHPGAFAEYFRVPQPNLRFDSLKIPDGISFEEATLIEPLACCIMAINKCKILPGDTVAVVGAGPAGVLLAILAKYRGASTVIISDLVDYRLNKAREVGVDVAVNPSRENFVERVKAESEGRGADVVIVTAPSIPAIQSGLDACRRGGMLLLFAPTSPEKVLEVRPHRLFFDQISIIPSYSTTHVETRMALNMIKAGRIDPNKIITHRFPLERTGDALRLAARSKECLKVIVVNE